MKILLVSHGDFAEGLCSTLTNFFGASNLYWASVTMDEGTGALLNKANAYLEEWGEEQVVICSDLKGGSANQTAFPLIVRPNTYLITGMNFSLVLQLMMEQEVNEEKINTIIQNAKEDMVLMNTLLLEMDDDDE